MSKITEFFDKVCSKQSVRTAVIYRDGKRVRRKSFSELSSDVINMAGYMKSKGIKRGDRILAFASSSYNLCAFMLASLKIGASIMYVDIWAKQENLRNVFSDYKPDMILVSDKTKHIRTFFGEIGKIKNIINIDKAQKYVADNVTFDEIGESETALLTMTTGSTGKPKIAVRTHADLLAQLNLIVDNINSSETETVLTTSYIYVFANILSGFTTVMPLLNLGKYSNKKINRLLGLFKNEEITMIITSPDFCLKADNVFPKLKTLYFGGAILNLNEAKRIRTKFGGCNAIVIYGSTECNLIASIGLDEYIGILGKEHRAVLGRPVKSVNVKLTDEGEILVSADALLENYLIADNSTKETDLSGALWHHTNDIAEEKDGLLYFRGKSGKCLDINGKKVYSNEIEQDIIASYPDIPKCAVIGYNGRIVVFTEKAKADLGEAQTIPENYEIRTIKKIPCDVKHHTKIDYEKLKERL